MLAHAHERGVVHRDVKPENLFLQHGRVDGAVLLDFGLARMIEEASVLTGRGIIVGTPYYIAPEQIRHSAVDARADLYSFGCVLYECLAGRRPHDARNLLELFAKRLGEPGAVATRDDPETPERLATLIDAMLQLDPEARPRDASVVATMLATCA